MSPHSATSRSLFRLAATAFDELRRDGVETVPLADNTLLQLDRLLRRQNTPFTGDAGAASRKEEAENLEARGKTAKSGTTVATGAVLTPHTSPLPAPLPPHPTLFPATTTQTTANATAGASATAAVIPAGTPNLTGLPDPASNKISRLNWLRERLDADQVCNAHKRPGKKLVFGAGDLDAEIFFVGEAPGAEEETAGEPFVGDAGALLTKIIAAMGISRDKTYIANVMKWRPEVNTAAAAPTGNRPPNADEIRWNLPFLRAQIDIVRPKVLVALGATAVNALLAPSPPLQIGKIRGTWREFESIPLMPTYHPAYLLRNNTNRTKRQTWEDLLLVMEKLAMPITQRQRAYFLTPQPR